MNLSTIEGRETPHTTTDDNTFYSEGEPRRVYWDFSHKETFVSNEPRQVSFASNPSPTPPPPPRTKENAEHGDVFSSKGDSVAAYLRGMRPAPISKEDTLMLRRNSNSNKNHQTLNYLILDYF